MVPVFSAAFKAAGEPALAVIAKLDVVALGKLKPELLVVDIDAVETDKLEMLRQIRFVLPGCVIIVFTADTERTWGLACHVAGANGMLAKDSDAKVIAEGVRGAVVNGCYTDPRFAA